MRILSKAKAEKSKGTSTKQERLQTTNKKQGYERQYNTINIFSLLV